ncbi:hypothetical protein [Haladaptatus sp. NG-SE-30]
MSNVRAIDCHREGTVGFETGIELDHSDFDDDFDDLDSGDCNDDETEVEIDGIDIEIG